MRQARLTEATLCVLRAFVSAPDRKLSGAQIGRETGMGPGSRYPILKRLEEAGWLEGQWEDIDPCQAGRPRSRLYGLTQLGREEARAALQNRAARVKTVLGRANV